MISINFLQFILNLFILDHPKKTSVDLDGVNAILEYGNPNKYLKCMIPIYDVVVVDDKLRIEAKKDWFLIIFSRENCIFSTYRLRVDVGITLSWSTIRRRLHEARHRAKKCLYYPLLNRESIVLCTEQF